MAKLFSIRFVGFVLDMMCECSSPICLLLTWYYVLGKGERLWTRWLIRMVGWA